MYVKAYLDLSGKSLDVIAAFGPCRGVCAVVVLPMAFRSEKSEDTIAWLRKRGLHSVPNSIKAEIGDLVYNGPKQNVPDDSTAFAPPPGRFVYFTGSRASNDPPPGL